MLSYSCCAKNPRRVYVCKEVIIGVNDDSIEGGFLGPYNYSNCQGSASSRRFSYLFRPNIKASHRIASQAVNNSYFKEALRAS